MPRRFTLTITLTAITLLSAGIVWLTNSQAVSDPTGLAETTPQGPGLERYVDPAGFFFDYPAGMKLSVTDDGDSHVIFGDTPEGKTRILITAYPYVLDEPLSQELILDQFGNDITPPIEPRGLSSGLPAFVFRRADTPMGATRDALFVHNGTAYQVSVAADFAELFNEILESWRFVPVPSL
jgi:hypothetical protein